MKDTNARVVVQPVLKGPRLLWSCLLMMVYLLRNVHLLWIFLSPMISYPDFYPSKLYLILLSFYKFICKTMVDAPFFWALCKNIYPIRFISTAFYPLLILVILFLLQLWICPCHVCAFASHLYFISSVFPMFT